jgi:hypothetical protein
MKLGHNRKKSRLSELNFLPMPSALSCEDAENLMSQSNPGDFEQWTSRGPVAACDIYLPDDSVAVNGVQDCCQPSQASSDLC